MNDEINLKAMKVAELKVIARLANVKTSGSKNELITRIEEVAKDDIIRYVEIMRQEYAEENDDGDVKQLEAHVVKLNGVVEQLTKQLHEIQTSANKTSSENTSSVEPGSVNQTTLGLNMQEVRTTVPITTSFNAPQSHTSLPFTSPYTVFTQQSQAALPFNVPQVTFTPCNAPQSVYASHAEAGLPFSVPQSTFTSFSSPQPVYVSNAHAVLSCSSQPIMSTQQSQAALPFSVPYCTQPSHLYTATSSRGSQPLFMPQIHRPQPHSSMQSNVAQSEYIPQYAQTIIHTSPQRRRRHNHSLQEMLAILPEFDPSDDSYTSLQFVRRIEQLAEVYEWDETLLVFAVLGKLRGVAKRWADAQQVFSTWSEFVGTFTEDFPNISNSANAHIKLMNAKISRGEKVVDYFYRMVSIGRRENIDDTSVCRYIINGLTDERMRTTLSAIDFVKCSDLLRSMTNMTSTNFYVSNNLNNLRNSQSQNVNRNEQFSRGIQGKNDNQQAVGVNRNDHGPVCFNCRQRGHIARNCPKPQRKERVNLVKVAKSTNAEEISDSNSNINSIVKEIKSRELLKQIKLVGGKSLECDALIDSGSSKSLIKKSLADKGKFEKLACYEKLKGFAGGEIICLEKVKAQIWFDEISYDAELLVIDDNILSYEVLVGTDVLSKATIIIEKGECTVLPIGSESLKIGESVSEVGLHKLLNVLDNHSHCFGEKLHELGRSNNFKMNISLTSAKPIVKKPYPIPIPKQHIVNSIVEELLTLGIIRNSHS